MTLSEAERYVRVVNRQAIITCENMVEIQQRMGENTVKFREQYIREYLESVQNNPSINTSGIPRVARGYDTITPALKLAIREKIEILQRNDEPDDTAFRTLSDDVKAQLIRIWEAEDTRRSRMRELWDAHIFRMRIEEQYLSQSQSSPPPPPPPITVKDKIIEEENCPICMEALTTCNAMVGACGHQYHATCMMKWMSKSQSDSKKCPCCRERVFE